MRRAECRAPMLQKDGNHDASMCQSAFFIIAYCIICFFMIEKYVHYVKVTLYKYDALAHMER